MRRCSGCLWCAGCSGCSGCSYTQVLRVLRVLRVLICAGAATLGRQRQHLARLRSTQTMSSLRNNTQAASHACLGMRTSMLALNIIPLLHLGDLKVAAVSKMAGTWKLQDRKAGPERTHSTGMHTQICIHSLTHAHAHTHTHTHHVHTAQQLT